jgi:riboflavin kinase / FMN adenylyltransferase
MKENRLQVVRTPEQLRALRSDGALCSLPWGVSIGNFDGMHLGHQALFSELQSGLGADGVRVLITFFPHPRVFFHRQSLPHITSLREKIRQAAAIGIDFFFIVRFDRQLSQLTAGDFLQRYIKQCCDPRLVVVGDDWGFGRGRSAGVEELRRYGSDNGIAVNVVAGKLVEGTRVSSRAIREALSAGKLNVAEQLLGRRFSFSGIVIHGDHRGARLGFPTANISPPNQLLPQDGVYASRLLHRGRWYAAVSNVGVRPTFGGMRRLVETHVLDKEELQLYQQRVELEFVARLREERRFSGQEELQAQIAADVLAAREKLAGA